MVFRPFRAAPRFLVSIQGRRPDQVGTCPWLLYFAPLALSARRKNSMVRLNTLKRCRSGTKLLGGARLTLFSIRTEVFPMRNLLLICVLTLLTICSTANAGPTLGELQL